MSASITFHSLAGEPDQSSLSIALPGSSRAAGRRGACRLPG
jgi:hypothetical protein